MKGWEKSEVNGEDMLGNVGMSNKGQGEQKGGQY